MKIQNCAAALRFKIVTKLKVQDENWGLRFWDVEGY